MTLARFSRHFLCAVLGIALVVGVAPAAQAQGTIVGTVRAVGSNEPLSDAAVLVVGSTAATRTSQNGTYRLTNIRAGNVDVQVLHVGFATQKKTVLVRAGETVTLDLRLVEAVVKLQEIVTTATGQQRKIELGNALATINASKLAEEAPIRSVTDLMTARAPSLAVTPGNYTGAAAQVRIRGLSSISNSGPPIYIVDGMRIEASNGIGLTGGGASSTRLNDILPQDIEDIEIVKGPSAATLYGTAAANGVVVITTKKGRAGHTNWTIQSEGGVISDRNEYPNAYANWGHTAGASTPTRCFLWTIADGSCISDSLTSSNLLTTEGITPLALGRRNMNSVQVSGGTDLVRFYTSGTFENETGPLEMPDYSRRWLDSLRIPVRDEWVHPEFLQRLSFRTNLNATISPHFDIGVTALYYRTNQRGAESDNNVNSYYYNAFNTPGFVPKDPQFCNANRAMCLGYPGIGSLGQDLRGWGGFTPAEIFQRYRNEDINRFGGTLSPTWRPFTWLVTDATIGMDLVSSNEIQHCYRDECADFSTQRQGNISDDHSMRRLFTTKLNSTAAWSPRSWLNLKTSVGADYINAPSPGNSSWGTSASSSTGLGPGVRNVEQAISRSGSNTAPTVTKTLGVYVQEQFGIHDRLFITGALRTDQNSAFGSKFQRVYYPKASLSWLLSEEPFFGVPKVFLDEFRLRVSYGQSGIQPGSTTALQTFSTGVIHLGDADASSLAANQIGNQDLRPELSEEWELGFDTRFLRNRVNVEATYYSKTTKDALENYSYAPSAAASSGVTLNLGGVKNAGVEASVTTTLVDRRNFAWDVTFGGSHNKNKVTHLGVYLGDTIRATPRTSTSRLVAGYPLNSVWYRPYTWNDDNNNKIIEPSEVHPADMSKGDSSQYVGPSFPTDLANVSTGFDLFNRKLRIQITANYAGGFNKFNNTQSFLCQQTPSCFASQNPDAPLWDQARQVASNVVLPAELRTAGGYSENLNFWRLREISGTYTLPNQIARRLFHALNATAVAGVRNLYVWSSYTGEDPEANYSTGNTQSDLLTRGPPTIFTFRVNLKY